MVRQAIMKFWFWLLVPAVIFGFMFIPGCTTSQTYPASGTLLEKIAYYQKYIDGVGNYLPMLAIFPVATPFVVAIEGAIKLCDAAIAELRACTVTASAPVVPAAQCALKDTQIYGYVNGINQLVAQAKAVAK